MRGGRYKGGMGQTTGKSFYRVTMMKIVASVLVVVALSSYSVQGASIGDLQASINIIGSELRVQAIQRLNQAAQASACASALLHPAIAELNRRLVLEQGQLRAEIPSLLASLPGLTVEQLVQQIRARVEPVVNSAVDAALNEINNCA